MLIWEYVGVSLGQGTKVVGDIGISLKNEDAVPNIIFLLVLYFFIRMIIEWSQCDSKTRNNVFSLTDAALSSFVALTSIIIYVAQLFFSNIKIPDFLDIKNLIMVIVGVSINALPFILSKYLFKNSIRKLEKSSRFFFLYAPLIVFFVGIINSSILGYIYYRDTIWSNTKLLSFAIAIFIGMVLAYCIIFVFWRLIFAPSMTPSRPLRHHHRTEASVVPTSPLSASEAE